MENIKELLENLKSEIMNELPEALTPAKLRLKVMLSFYRIIAKANRIA